MAFYADGTLFVAPFDLDRQEISGAPVPVFENVAAGQYTMMNYGKRFIVLLPEEDSEGPTTGHPILVLNWFDEIKRLVPTEN